MQNQISSSCDKCMDYDICLLSMQDLSKVCAWYKKAYSRSNKVETVGDIVLTEEQYKVKEAVRLCNIILKEGVRLYDNVPELVQHWISKGIAEVKEIENPWSYARQFDPTIKVAYLVESHRSDIELVKGLMIGFYKI